MVNMGFISLCYLSLFIFFLVFKFTHSNHPDNLSFLFCLHIYDNKNRTKTLKNKIKKKNTNKEPLSAGVSFDLFIGPHIMYVI